MFTHIPRHGSHPRRDQAGCRAHAPVRRSPGRKHPRIYPHPPPAKEGTMNHFRRILAAVITLTGAVLAMATTPAAFANPLPPPDCCTSNRVSDAPVTVITAGGMPGWQITLIALGAALVAAIAAVTLDRTLANRRSVSSTTA
jgi:hypothetical protein